MKRLSTALLLSCATLSCAAAWTNPNPHPVQFGEAKSLSYDQLAREPNKYKGTPVCLKGKIIQISYNSRDELETMMRIDLNPGMFSMDGVIATWFHRASVDEPRLLEDDYVEFCGLANGTYTYESAMVHIQITVPDIWTDVWKRVGKDDPMTTGALPVPPTTSPVIEQIEQKDRNCRTLDGNAC